MSYNRGFFDGFRYIFVFILLNNWCFWYSFLVVEGFDWYLSFCLRVGREDVGLEELRRVINYKFSIFFVVIISFLE